MVATMTQKEKAERYDEAIEGIQEILSSGQESIKMSRLQLRLQGIFPELKESEDERIRKAIINVFKGNTPYTSDEEAKKYIAWLEKQGKQPQGKTALEAVKEEKVDNQNCVKSTDKVESKFKVGDYVVGKYISGYISEVRDDCYLLGYQGFSIDKQDNYHLWNINDAKPGDVLAFYSEYRGNKMVQVGIIEKYVGKHGGCSNTFKIYVGVNWDNNLQIDDYMGCSDILPATKEQRDILYKAMADAGYVFDFAKKELKKIVQKHAEWNEEDEKNLQGILDEIEANKSEAPEYDIDTYNRFVDWLESIKQRIGG